MKPVSSTHAFGNLSTDHVADSDPRDDRYVHGQTRIAPGAAPTIEPEGVCAPAGSIPPRSSRRVANFFITRPPFIEEMCCSGMAAYSAPTQARFTGHRLLLVGLRGQTSRKAVAC